MITLEETRTNFDERRVNAIELGCDSLEDLHNQISDYRSKGFIYDPKIDERTGAEIPGTRTSNGGHLTIPEANMILEGRPMTGHIRHIEAFHALRYINLFNFYQELTGTDEHHTYVPA